MRIDTYDREISFVEKVIMFYHKLMNEEYEPMIKVYRSISTPEEPMSNVIMFEKFKNDKQYALVAKLIAEKTQIEILFTHADIERLNQVINIE